jgi:hypothetical protein
VIIAHSINCRFAARIGELLCAERIMELPLRAESLECGQVGDTNCTSLWKLCAIVRHLRLDSALVQLQAQYNHCGEAASGKCLSAATFVRRQRGCEVTSMPHDHRVSWRVRMPLPKTCIVALEVRAQWCSSRNRLSGGFQDTSGFPRS